MKNNTHDQGELGTYHPNIWAIFMEKGYNGAEGISSSIITRKSRSGNLSRAGEKRNLKISSYRIIFENFFDGSVGC